MLTQEIEKLNQLAKSWNNLDTSFIELELAEDFIYESQWVLTPIKGKVQFLSYLKLKFSAIKSEITSVKAEIVFHPSLQNKAGIVLTQITKQGIIQVSLLIKIEEGKIKRIDVCFIPDPSEAILTGEFPI